MTPTPTPLPASSPKLRERRYEVNILGAKTERGSYPVLAEGRFLTISRAKDWADQVHPDAPSVTITFYSARTGWRPQAQLRRKDGEWRRWAS